jgi:hypothetical protein
MRASGTSDEDIDSSYHSNGEEHTGFKIATRLCNRDVILIDLLMSIL